MGLLATATFALLLGASVHASAADLRGGAGGAALELGAAASIANSITVRLELDALAGMRKVYEIAQSVGNRFGFKGVAHAAQGGDSFDFHAGRPEARPYGVVGWGHGQDSAAGLRFYANLGVLVGRPVINLTPTSGLASGFSTSYVAAEQQSARYMADGSRSYPAVKVGISYAF